MAKTLLESVSKRFAGEFVERMTRNRTTTMQFKLAALKDAVVEEQVDVGIHETLYPLLVPAEQLHNTKLFRIGRSGNMQESQQQECL